MLIVMESVYSFRKVTLVFFLLCVCAISFTRLMFSISQRLNGNKVFLESYSFCVIFPAVLIFVLAFLGKTKTKEGLLMRFGTMIQLFLIICFPVFSLYLALGLPVVFLVVEILVQHTPKSLFSAIERIIIR